MQIIQWKRISSAYNQNAHVCGFLICIIRLKISWPWVVFSKQAVDENNSFALGLYEIFWFSCAIQR